MNSNLKDYISVIAIIISIISFSISIYDRKVKLSAYMVSLGDEYYIDIYNLSNRKVTIPYFELFHSKWRFLFRVC